MRKVGRGQRGGDGRGLGRAILVCDSGGSRVTAWGDEAGGWVNGWVGGWLSGWAGGQEGR